ncbi:hypothetical protein EDD21DRAFT_360841 [Dissophora ornata]|nr:hypothetical protein BGZ58_002093 [Dissophora ornata]KAI8606488.1 hypothetical protein EDD21DRAFT_360841 [Dissophora ornata]
MTVPSNALPDSRASAGAFVHNDIHLIHATSPEIIKRTWNNTRIEWGRTYDADTYTARETLLSSQDFTNNGKLKVWILVPKTFDSANPDLDLILSSVESFERPGVVATKEQGVRDVLSVSVATVFTPAHYRGNGYASLMMKLLWKEIEKMDGVSFTFLYSDVGPTFYGRVGWTPRRSDEIVIPASPSLAVAVGHSATLENVTDQNLSELVERDAQLLRETLQAQLDSSSSEDKVLVAAMPEINCINWLHARSRFTAKHGLKLEQPQIAVLGAKDTQSDSFILWYHDLLNNQLYVIRWRLDANAGSKAARALVQAAQAEAQKWNLEKVMIWNPEQSLVDILGLEIKYREDSIPCLGLVNSMQDTNNVEWLLNEKYAWC